MFIGLNNAITGLTQDQLSKTINSLFSKNEQGVWYDPSDFSTMYQDAAGTTPVTGMEQPVGLILDKSKRLVLSSELVTNGTFAENINGWTAGSEFSSISWVAGKLRVSTTSTISQGKSAYQPLPVVAGKTYKISGNATIVAGSFNVVNITLRDGVSSATSNLIVTTVTTMGDGSEASFIYTATSTTTLYIHCRVVNTTTPATVDYDNISVRELPGNHAYQSTSASRPVLSARVNLLTYTEQFDNAAWVKINVTVTPDAAIAPDGTMNADKLIANTGDLQHYIRHAAYVADGVNGTSIIYAKAAGITSISCAASGAAAVQATYNLDTGTITSSTGGVASITSVGNGWYKCSFVCTTAGYSNTPYWFVGSYAKYVGNGTDGIYIWGADLRPTNSGINLPPYQRVNTATDYDTAGFPMYLRFDGVDDFLQTNSIDFTATDKMTVLAGVRKLSDAAIGMIAELTTDAGTLNGFYLGSDTTPSYRFVAGTPIVGIRPNTGTESSPHTAVLAASCDKTQATASAALSIRINAALRNEYVLAEADPTGNFANAPLYIGRRGGTTNTFNGQLYGLVIRGALSSTGEIQGAESYMNLHTRAY